MDNKQARTEKGGADQRALNLAIEEVNVNIGTLDSKDYANGARYFKSKNVNSDVNDIYRMSKNSFQEQMGYLANLKRPIVPLSEWSTYPEATVITFDDGYEDNFKNAKPILEEFNVPATFFITSGFIHALITFKRKI